MQSSGSGRLAEGNCRPFMVELLPFSSIHMDSEGGRVDNELGCEFRRARAICRSDVEGSRQKRGCELESAVRKIGAVERCGFSAKSLLVCFKLKIRCDGEMYCILTSML